MQIRALLDPEQFPDSPYANELRRDFPDLRFSPALEKDFQTFQLGRARSRVRFYDRVYVPAARIILPLLGILAAVGVAARVVAGHPDQFYFLTSYSIALFFVGGQSFRESLIANVLMIIANGVALTWMGESAGS